ncbi:hypothetical protein HDU93_000305, partial [Gonapodya sp. JEL0774]
MRLRLSLVINAAEAAPPGVIIPENQSQSSLLEVEGRTSLAMSDSTRAPSSALAHELQSFGPIMTIKVPEPIGTKPNSSKSHSKLWIFVVRIVALVALGLSPVLITVPLVLAGPDDPPIFLNSDNIRQKKTLCDPRVLRLFLILKLVLSTTVFFGALLTSLQACLVHNASLLKEKSRWAARDIFRIKWTLITLWILARLAWQGFGCYVWFGLEDDYDPQACYREESTRLRIASQFYFYIGWIIAFDDAVVVLAGAL